MLDIFRLILVLAACIALRSDTFVNGAAIDRSPSATASSGLPETLGVQPIPCHSHNDYLRTHPLVDALENGCISVEADIWQKNDLKNDLRVGHTEGSLSKDRTLKSMYITPIVQRLQTMNVGREVTQGTQAPWSGLWLNNKTQSTVLLIDFKTGGDATWSTLMASLEPLRTGGWLSYWDINKEQFIPGAITMVMSGKSTYEQVIKSSYSNGTLLVRDVFLDAPLVNLGTDHQYNTSNSFYASTNYAKAGDSNAIRAQIAAANKLNLLSRYWNAPDTRGSIRERDIWKMLLKDQVSRYNTDHLTTFKKWWDNERNS